MTAKGYWVGSVKVLDQAGYDAYRALNGAAFEKYGARFVVRGGQHQVVEGRAHDRNVVIEFDSYQIALDCYNSPEYQNARAKREGATDTNLVIIEGYEG